MPLSGPIRHAYICHICGSDHVARDARVIWDVSAQNWVIETLFDQAHCQHCDDRTRLQRVVLTSPTTFAAPEGGVD